MAVQHAELAFYRRERESIEAEKASLVADRASFVEEREDFEYRFCNTEARNLELEMDLFAIRARCVCGAVKLETLRIEIEE